VVPEQRDVLLQKPQSATLPPVRNTTHYDNILLQLICLLY
jgi:hypothetical protein